MATGLSRRRWQYEQLRVCDGFVLQAVADSAVEQGAGGMLAGECEQPWLMAFDLCDQGRNVERIARQFVIVAGVTLGEVGKTDAVVG